ncbi:hypothetical protein ACE193_22215 [Bernardetia sp. OM2101]|uniref:hypothetical protein n=1 Tax=Bernardetia sp. OM2101 TaxID=3344876 RepID=UPI0035D006DF
MHTHKIDSTLETHQNFLAQNRKDPITGDAILEGDEVVFCAGCKSVFFKDTWEYLGKQHCEQYETLAKFPVQKTIRLKVEDSILFYTSLPKSGKSQTRIPNKAKETPWIQTSQEVSPYQHIFHNPLMKAGQYIFLAIYMFMVFSMKTVLYPLFFIIPLIFQGSIWLHDWYYGGKLESTYQHFANNTFYITKKSIGFATKYGIEEFVLPAQDIEGIVFHEKNNLFADSYCKIHYKRNEISQTIKFKIDSGIFQNGTILFSALNALSTNHNTPIYIESKKENTLYHVQKVIANGNSNIRIFNL